MTDAPALTADELQEARRRELRRKKLLTNSANRLDAICGVPSKQIASPLDKPTSTKHENPKETKEAADLPSAVSDKPLVSFPQLLTHTEPTLSAMAYSTHSKSPNFIEASAAKTQTPMDPSWKPLVAAISHSYPSPNFENNCSNQRLVGVLLTLLFSVSLILWPQLSIALSSAFLVIRFTMEYLYFSASPTLESNVLNFISWLLPAEIRSHSVRLLLICKQVLEDHLIALFYVCILYHIPTIDLGRLTKEVVNAL